MNQIYEKLVKCADAVKSKIKFQPKVALILGSGLGDYAETMQVEETMEYTEIEGFPVSTVAGHKGRFLFGYVEGVPVTSDGNAGSKNRDADQRSRRCEF